MLPSLGLSLGQIPGCAETFSKQKRFCRSPSSCSLPSSSPLRLFQSKPKAPRPDEQKVNKNQVTEPFATGKEEEGRKEHLSGEDGQGCVRGGSEALDLGVGTAASSSGRVRWPASAAAADQDDRPLRQGRGGRGPRGPGARREGQPGARDRWGTYPSLQSPLGTRRLVTCHLGPERAKQPPNVTRQV